MTNWIQNVKCIVFTVLVSLGSTDLYAAAPAPRVEERRFEVQFMSQMADHHTGALLMAQMCKEKATHAELKQMCEQIVQAQTAEIAKLKTWLKDWYGTDYEPRVPAETKRSMAEMEMMTGAEFEIMLMKMFIHHHAMAIMMSAECLVKSYHSELDKMCMDIIEAQTAEIKQLKKWLCEWYQICEGQGREDDMRTPPRLQSMKSQDGTVRLAFFAERGKAYAIDATDSLPFGQGTVVTALAEGTGVQEVAVSVSGTTRRFYRLSVTN